MFDDYDPRDEKYFIDFVWEAIENEGFDEEKREAFSYDVGTYLCFMFGSSDAIQKKEIELLEIIEKELKTRI